MFIKIQINSYDALVKFLESQSSDNEIEIEFKQAIINAFANTHVKPLYTQELTKNISDIARIEVKNVNSIIDKEIKKAIDNYFDIEIIDQGHWKDKREDRTLTDEAKKKIESYASGYFYDAIQNGIGSSVRTYLTEKRIENKIESYLDFYVEKILDKRIKQEEIKLQSMKNLKNEGK